LSEVVIIGAGLTGLSAAYHLEKQGFYDFEIFEKECSPGGLARSVVQDGFTFDYTGHLLHSNNNYFSSFLNYMMPKGSLNKITRNSFVYSHDKFISYPFQMNISQLPMQSLLECIIGFAKRKHQINDPENFHEWALKYFGSGICKNFFFPYNRKLLGYDLKKVTTCWTGNFVPKITIEQILEQFKSDHDSKKIGYNSWFYYPNSGGIESLVKAVVKKISTKIQLQHEVVSIDLKQKTLVFNNGKTTKFKKLISTMPLDELLKKIVPDSIHNFETAQSNLFCNSVINFNLGLRTPDPNNQHWIYVPEKKFPFYRFGFWNNFSDKMAPPNHSSIYGEISFLKNKNKLKQSKLTEESIDQMLDILKIPHNKMILKKILHLPHAYVIFNKWRQKNLEKLLSCLESLSVDSIGRYGGWKYSSMQDAILDGRSVAEKTVPLRIENELSLPTNAGFKGSCDGQTKKVL
jgi:protoporphyrinogen oxidase